MRYDRRNGLLIPRRLGASCAILGVNQLGGFGVGGDEASDPGPSQPLWNGSDSSGSFSVTDSGRTCSTSAVGSIRSTVAVNTAFGRYVEYSAVQNAGNAGWRVGIANGAKNVSTALGVDADGIALRGNDGHVLLNNSDIGTTGLSAPNAVLMFATKNGRVWFGENGVWDGDPAAGTGGYASGLTGNVYLCWGHATSGASRGATLEVLGAYTYSPPTGFVAGW